MQAKRWSSFISSSDESSGDPREGWRYLGWLAAAIGLGTIVFIVATEIMVRSLVIPNDTFARHLEVLRTARNVDVVLGDSQLSRSVTGIPGVVNLAYASDTVEDMLGKARTYFRDLQPSNVVVQASPQFFSRRRLVLPDVYAEATGEESHVRLAMLHPRRRVQLLSYWAVLLSDGGFRNRYRFADDGAELSRERFADVSVRRREALAARRVRTHTPVDAFADRPAAAHYRSLVAYLQERGAVLCLVGPPVTSEYRNAATSVAEIGAARSYFHALADRRGIPYRDYWAATDDARLFADSDHLNIDGARWFSSQVWSDCFEMPTP